MARCLLLLLPPMITLFAMSHVEATIFIPEEIPSLLSVVYSNLPPIKKGTDSKLGFGFRLGPNADVQFQLEIGPQTYTRPIGNAATAVPSKKRQATGVNGEVKPKEWLNNWRLQMSPDYVPDDEQNTVDEETVDVPAMVSVDAPSDAVAHLRQLYRPIPV